MPMRWWRRLADICCSVPHFHIHAIAQGRPEDNQVEFLQRPHGIVNQQKNLVLNNIRRFTMEHIGAANGLCATVATSCDWDLFTSLDSTWCTMWGLIASVATGHPSHTVARLNVYFRRK